MLIGSKKVTPKINICQRFDRDAVVFIRTHQVQTGNTLNTH